jgi:hypothetical protein
MIRAFTTLKKLSRRHAFLLPSFRHVLIGPLLPNKKMVFTNESLSMLSISSVLNGIHPRSLIRGVCSMVVRAFNGDIHAWDASNVTKPHEIFDGCPIPTTHKPPGHVALVDWKCNCHG